MFRAHVVDRGGYHVEMVMDRDFEEYPDRGESVVVMSAAEYARLHKMAYLTIPIPRWLRR